MFPMEFSRTSPLPVRSIRSRFLRGSALIASVLLAAFAIQMLMQFQIHRQMATLEGVLVPRWRASLQLESDMRGLSTQVARIPLSTTRAEARTIRDRVVGAHDLMRISMARSLPEPEEHPLRIALEASLADILHRMEHAVAVTDRRLSLIRAGESDPEQRALIDAARREERDIARHLDDLGLILASHASLVTLENEARLRDGSAHIARLRFWQSGLLVAAGLLVGFLLWAQFRLIDRRLLQRITQLQRGMTHGAIAPELLQTEGKQDELDVMLAELSALFDRLAEQRTLLQQQAASDPLTGLANRRTLQARLEEEVRRAERYRRPFSLLLIDIDHFKQINDRLGHAAGDLVLRGLVQELNSNTRHSDLLARYGGEEFVLLLPETDAPSACELAELLRQRVSSLPLIIEGQPCPLTISVGCASLRENEAPAALIERADQAMYRAKRGGRNQVVQA